MNDSSKPAASSAGRTKIVLERTYQADVEELWNLWTTTEGFESWWGPEGFRVEVRTLDARVGGVLHYEMIADTTEHIETLKRMGRPPAHAARARFVELQPLERLAITHTIDFLPDVPPYDSTIAVEFVPQGTGVRMVITMDPMHNEEFTRMSQLGFESQLTKIDKRFV